jgi:hypothetical protein
LFVDDDFFELGLAVVADVFVDGHNWIFSLTTEFLTKDREILPRSTPPA